MSDDILNHPHSRFVASTNYTQYYTKQYENDIISKKEEFENFFLNFRKVKEDEIAFLDLQNTIKNSESLKNDYKLLKSINNTKLNSNVSPLLEISEKRGQIKEYNDFIRRSLDAIKSRSSTAINYITSNSKNKYNIPGNTKTDTYSIEDQINTFNSQGNKIMEDVFKIEHDNQQKLFNNAESQILQAKMQKNSYLYQDLQ